MIKRTFAFEVGQDQETYFNKAQTAAASAGASFTGTPLRGTLSHRGIHGRYRVEDGRVTIEIDKPIGVPWGPIERALERFFDQEIRPDLPHQPSPSVQ